MAFHNLWYLYVVLSMVIFIWWHRLWLYGQFTNSVMSSVPNVYEQFAYKGQHLYFFCDFYCKCKTVNVFGNLLCPKSYSVIELRMIIKWTSVVLSCILEVAWCVYINIYIKIFFLTSVWMTPIWARGVSSWTVTELLILSVIKYIEILILLLNESLILIGSEGALKRQWNFSPYWR